MEGSAQSGGTQAAAAGGAAGTTQTTANPGPGQGQTAPAAEATITVGDQVFKASDVQGILTAKRGLEKEKKDLEAKLAEHEKAKLSDVEKAQADAKKAKEDNARLAKRLADSIVQAELDKAGIKIKAEHLNLGIEGEGDALEKVQKFIKDNPGLATTQQGTAGQVNTSGLPAGQSPSPAAAATAADKEKQLIEAFNNAKTAKEWEAAKKALDEFRGTASGSSRQIL